MMRLANFTFYYNDNDSELEDEIQNYVIYMGALTCYFLEELKKISKNLNLSDTDKVVEIIKKLEKQDVIEANYEEKLLKSCIKMSKKEMDFSKLNSDEVSICGSYFYNDYYFLTRENLTDIEKQENKKIQNARKKIKNEIQIILNEIEIKENFKEIIIDFENSY